MIANDRESIVPEAVRQKLLEETPRPIGTETGCLPPHDNSPVVQGVHWEEAYGTEEGDPIFRLESWPFRALKVSAKR